MEINSINSLLRLVKLNEALNPSLMDAMDEAEMDQSDFADAFEPSFQALKLAEDAERQLETLNDWLK